MQLSRPRVVVAVVAEFGCSSYAQFGKEVLRVQKQKLNSVVVYSLDPVCVCVFCRLKSLASSLAIGGEERAEAAEFQSIQLEAAEAMAKKALHYWRSMTTVAAAAGTYSPPQ
jgi:hypothetical protein